MCFFLPTSYDQPAPTRSLQLPAGESWSHFGEFPCWDANSVVFFSYCFVFCQGWVPSTAQCHFQTKDDCMDLHLEIPTMKATVYIPWKCWFHSFICSFIHSTNIRCTYWLPYAKFCMPMFTEVAEALISKSEKNNGRGWWGRNMSDDVRRHLWEDEAWTEVWGNSQPGRNEERWKRAQAEWPLVRTAPRLLAEVTPYRLWDMAWFFRFSSVNQLHIFGMAKQRIEGMKMQL